MEEAAREFEKMAYPGVSLLVCNMIVSSIGA